MSPFLQSLTLPPSPRKRDLRRDRLFSKGELHLRIPYRKSPIAHPVSRFPHLVSHIPYPTSRIPYPESCLTLLHSTPYDYGVYYIGHV